MLGLCRAFSAMLFGSALSGLSDLISTVIAHGFQMYLILVIYSYYNKILGGK